MATEDPIRRAQAFPQLDGVRWHGGGGHVESYFLKANDPQTPGRAVWVKYTLLSPTGRPDQAVAEVWGIRFDRGANCGGKTTVPAAECRLGSEAIDLEIGTASLSKNHCRGQAGPLSWDFRFTAGEPAMYVFAYPWMYTRGFPKNKLYTPMPNLQMHGTLQVGDETWELDGWPGAFGHNWGPAHNPEYHWTHCNMFTGEPDAVFEAFSGKIDLGPVRSPWLTGARLRFRGEEYPFDAFHRLWRPRVEASQLRWQFVSRQGPHRLTWSVQGAHENFVGLQYVNPDGGLRHCLNTKVADCELLLERRERGQWCEVATLRADRSCAYEILTEDFDHGIEVLA